jgi:hypothetical protein
MLDRRGRYVKLILFKGTFPIYKNYKSTKGMISQFPRSFQLTSFVEKYISKIS